MTNVEKELHEAKSEIVGLQMQVFVLRQNIDDLKELLANEQRISTALREENYRLRTPLAESGGNGGYIRNMHNTSSP